MRTPRSSLLLIALLFFAILASPITAADLDSAQYFTLQKGDEWIMDTTITLPNGTMLKSTGHLSIEGTVEKNGKTYFRGRTWLDGLASRFESTRLLRRDADGAYSIEDNESGAKEQVEMMFPIKAGNTWNTEKEGKPRTFTIVGIETITVGDKTYENCVHLRIVSSDGTTNDNWEAPKIGAVKLMDVRSDGTTILMTLTEFKPGK